MINNIKLLQVTLNLFKGCYGTVYLWHDKNDSNRSFALKQLVVKKSLKEGLLTEIQAMMECQHENVLQCLGYTVGKNNFIFICILYFYLYYLYIFTV